MTPSATNHHRTPGRERRAHRGRVARRAVIAVSLAAGFVAAPASSGQAEPPVATQLDLVGPEGSGLFGEDVLVLSNGNYVVTDPGYDLDGIVDVGAVHLFDGETNQLISTVTGSTAGDEVGNRTPVEVGDGDVAVLASSWDFGGVVDAGALIHIDGTLGFSGQIDPTNSLHGTATDDLRGTIVPLTNGNYTARFPDWDDGATIDVGAVVFFPAEGGVVGPVTTDNSLHGSNVGDRVGSVGVLALDNGNYVVGSHSWSDGVTSRIGASTWVDGTTGLTGPVTTSNSLHGSSPNDEVGTARPVGDSNYVVTNSVWDGPVVDGGAVTWVDGSTGLTGPVTTSNSLYGTTVGDRVGSAGITTLVNGNYIVGTYLWDFGILTDVGAATWADGDTGITGPVTPANSLHGTTANDFVGLNGVVALTNGNYVVNANQWDNGALVNAGAAVWGDGTTGISGPVTTSNSLYGTSAEDSVGRSVALANGHYVVTSRSWDDGATPDVGAVTWGDGTTGITGPITTANSMHGTTANDSVGFVSSLSNGDYVVLARDWDNGALVDAGAVVLADGAMGTTGPVTTDNSLHGTQAGDRVGLYGAVELTDGNYVVVSPAWAFGAEQYAGAITWVDGSTGSPGPVTAGNSLHGSTTGDAVGSVDGGGGVIALPRGRYVVVSDEWDDGGMADVGAVTVGRSGGSTGPVTAENSAIGTPGVGMDLIGEAVETVTAGGAIVVQTFQNRVILVLSDLVSRNPARLLDTRSGDGISTVDGLALGWGRVDPGTAIQIQIAGRGGVPSNARTATLNLASIAPTGVGYATLYPCTDEPPLVSALNYQAGSNVSNATLVTLSDAGTICLFSSASAHYAIDVVGYTPDGSRVGTLEPGRLLDTRSGPDIATVDGESLGAGRLLAGAFVEVEVAGRGSVPDDATSAILNLAAIAPSGRGFATLYPCTPERPVVSALNYEAGQNISNATVVKLSETGTVCLYTSTEAHYALDVSGFVPPGSNFETLEPGRLLDTRFGDDITTVDGVGVGAGRVEAMGVIEVPVAGRGGVPTGAESALVNLATVAPGGKGYATLYPCTDSPPNASSLNYEASSNISNATLVRLSDQGNVCVFTSAEAHLALDVLGFVE
jgi:Repeat of unknown function (DUF5650)